MRPEDIVATIRSVDPVMADLVAAEDARQSACIRLIPSENYASPAVRAALASNFTNKYGEGYPGRRYYQGQEFTDKMETEVQRRACELFGYPYSVVQALSGAPANLGVYAAFLKPFAGKIMAMRLDHGGHLTHGSPVSVTGQWFEIASYGCDEGDVLDMAQIREQALAFEPDILVCGYTAYPRTIDFEAFGRIAAEVGAISLADISHIAGLVAGGAHPSPWPHIDIVTFTTHKTLRGPRAAIILAKDEARYQAVEKAVFPGLQGGPHFNTIAAIGVCLAEAATPGFKAYTAQVVQNAQALAAALMERGFHVSSGGTDNHLLLVDTVKSRKLPGRRVAIALEEVGIVLNFNTVPNASEGQKPLFPDGVRMGTPSVTTRGMKPDDMVIIADFIDICCSIVKRGKIEKGTGVFTDTDARDALAEKVFEFTARFPTFAY
ncbi:MAG: serine hydroxymethyltransferase [Pseudomonadota bacterium]